MSETVSTTFAINPAKLAALDTITLDEGAHGDFVEGHCSMEVVAWLADLGHTAAPACASEVLTRYVIRLNDRWDNEQRQALKPYLPRLVGTAGDGFDPARERIAARYVVDLMVPWLNLAGLTTEAEAVTEAGTDTDALRLALYTARSAAWDVRRKARQELEAKIRDRLAGKDTVAADVAVAAVVAAAADVAADVAAAAAVAADVVAVADVVAAAAAVADVDAAADPWATSYSAAYKAARAYYKANPLPIAQEVAALAASQQGVALELLDAMINPAVEE